MTANITRKIDSLVAMRAGTFTAKINVSGETWEIECRELTRAELVAIEEEVPDPKPNVMAGPSGMIELTDDPVYQQAKEDAAQERLMNKLAEMMHIEGHTRAEKIKALVDAPAAFVNGLVRMLQLTQFAQEVRIDEQSRSFRREGSSASTGTDGARVDAGVLALSASE